MSTSFFRPRSPFTYIRGADLEDDVATIGLYAADSYLGFLQVPKGALREVLEALFETDADDAHCPVREVNGRLRWNDAAYQRSPDHLSVLSEYGDLVTLGELRGRFADDSR